MSEIILSSQIDRFDALLVESVDEAVRSLFSQQVVNALHENLKTVRSVDEKDIPSSLPVLSIVLAKYFGLGAPTIENNIAKGLYSKLGLEFQKKQEYKLIDYVQNARNKLNPSCSHI